LLIRYHHDGGAFSNFHAFDADSLAADFYVRGFPLAHGLIIDDRQPMGWWA